MNPEVVHVSTNEHFADEFAAYLDERPYEKPRLSVEDTAEEDEKFGVVGALAQLIDREEVDDDLLVVAGDNLLSFDLAEFVDFFEAQGTPTLAAYDVGSRERASAYGLVDLDGTQVIDFQEKPDEPKSTLVSIACYAFPRETFSLFETYLAEDGNPDEPGWFIQWLCQDRPVNAFTFDSAWFDIGSTQGYLEAVEWTLDGECQVAESATVEDTTLKDTSVMADAEIRDATVEGSVVFPEATITDATVKRSVVDEHATVSGIDIAESTVGAYSEVNAADPTETQPPMAGLQEQKRTDD